MIYQQLESIVNNGRKQKLQTLYIRSQLKEYLQLYLLYYVYTSDLYRDKFIFTGGTCLRHFYGLERLSEDIDFDIDGEIEVIDLQLGIKNFFEKKYLLENVNVSIKQQGKQILLKFPVLQKLDLASKNESDFLYIKMDLSPLFPEQYRVITESKSSKGINFVAKHYDLSTLMTNKIHAIFERKVLKGKLNKSTIKSRDYFDLLWFLKQGVKLNLKRLRALTGNPRIQLSEIEELLDEKVKILNDKFLNDFESDLLPFVSDPGFVKSYVKNYKEEYLHSKVKSFVKTMSLMVQCKNCNKQFSSGIEISKESFDSISLSDNSHICPFCKYENTVNKNDYILGQY